MARSMNILVILGALLGLVVTSLPKVPIWKMLSFNRVSPNVGRISLIIMEFQLFQRQARSGAAVRPLCEIVTAGADELVWHWYAQCANSRPMKVEVTLNGPN